MTTADIQGKVITVVPGAAPVLGFLTSPAGILSSIAIVLGATALLSSLSGRRDDDNDGTDPESASQTQDEDQGPRCPAEA